MAERMDDFRAKSFRILKPPCVEVSQLALKYKTKNATSQDLVNSLQTLFDALQLQNIVLDVNLADYCFFPLSHIFRDAKQTPVRALEIALQCLRVLISKGWRDQMSSEMAKQLLMLLSFIAGGDPSDSNVKNVNEELGIAVYENLTSMARVCRNLGLGDQESIKIEGFPVLGHTVSVMIGGIIEGPSVKVRLAAVMALKSTVKSIVDKDALKNIFPGIVSSLTKVLSGKGQLRPHLRVLDTSLDLLELVLRTVIGDMEVKCHEDQDRNLAENQENPNSWLEATSHQVKMALANIMPLRYHERQEVQIALSQLCTSVITNCRESLSGSISMLIEALLILSANSTQKVGIPSTFTRLLQNDLSLGDILKASLHDSLQTLPRIIQGNDDISKVRLIRQITTAYSILSNLGANTEPLNESLASHLQASITAGIQQSSKGMIESIPKSTSDIAQTLQLARNPAPSLTFSPILFREAGTRNVLEGFGQFTAQLQTVSSADSIEKFILGPLRTATGYEQLASMWLSVQFCKREVSESMLIDEYVDSEVLQRPSSFLLDEVYSFALTVLSQSTFESSDSTWPLQALSLEALALQSQVQGQLFRPELVEALYPILERLGSHNAALQEHAMTCLNIVSKACKYQSSAALIVDNADYLVNAISLKLNTFDISPQAPKVLVMMVRLCGAPLIPFMDDLVDSIFSILACYHGYPKLVESLFTVLNTIVEESGKSLVTLIENTKDTTTRPKPYKPMTMTELAEFLQDRREKKKARPISPLPDSSPPTSPPSRPFTPLSKTDDEVPDENTLPAADPPAPKPSKTNTIVTSITSLTPSHLGSPSSTLRTSLLQLLSTSLPQLARDTDTFLPIAAQLYPYIATRLFEPSTAAFEIIPAAGAMTVLCQCAGDFLRSRTDDDWSRLEKLFVKMEAHMREEVRAQRGRTGGMWWRAWDAVVGLIIGIVHNVGISDQATAEDWLYLTLGVYVGGWKEDEGTSGGKDGSKGKLERQTVKREQGNEGLMSQERKEELEKHLEGLNPDYLWLVQERGRVQRGGERQERPEDIADIQFRDIDY